MPSPRVPIAATCVRILCISTHTGRQASQRFRGGGYACSADPVLWAALTELLAEVELCPGAPAPQGAQAGRAGGDAA